MGMLTNGDLPKGCFVYIDALVVVKLLSVVNPEFFLVVVIVVFFVVVVVVVAFVVGGEYFSVVDETVEN